MRIALKRFLSLAAKSDRYHLTVRSAFWQTDDSMKLPNGERAELGTKIEDYVLNPNHWEGRHKARVFESTLGITVNNQEVLREAILEAAANLDEANAIGDNGHGMVYVLRFPLTTANRTAMILTAWIILHGEDFPRLVTCYIL
jgi:hypothetical protein